MENMLRVGVITSTHGVRGEVKVFPTTDDAKRFKKAVNATNRLRQCSSPSPTTARLLQIHEPPLKSPIN